jgi:hypothetical protein
VRAFVITSGIIFGLITLAHIARIVFENPELAKDPVFMLLTVATGGLSIWAWRVLPGSVS